MSMFLFLGGGWDIITRWWFQIFFIFTPTWGNDPTWLLFFRWVETTNQIKTSQVQNLQSDWCAWIKISRRKSLCHKTKSPRRSEAVRFFWVSVDASPSARNQMKVEMYRVGWLFNMLDSSRPKATSIVCLWCLWCFHQSGEHIGDE